MRWKQASVTCPGTFAQRRYEPPPAPWFAQTPPGATRPPALRGGGPGVGNPCLVWLRQDLRLHDNPALEAALRSGKPVIPVFIAPPDEEQGGWALGGCSKIWLHHSLARLDAALREHCGSGLVLRLGPALEELLQLITETGADTVIWSRVYVKFRPVFRHFDRVDLDVRGHT